jgi:hypothetical protein
VENRAAFTLRGEHLPPNKSENGRQKLVAEKFELQNDSSFALGYTLAHISPRR